MDWRLSIIIWNRKTVMSGTFHIFCLQRTTAQCLKITEKVSFNIASEASYLYILSGQKIVHFERAEACGQTVLPDTSIGGKCQNVIFKHCVWVRILQHLGLTSINLTELWKFTYFSPFEILSVCKNSWSVDPNSWSKQRWKVHFCCLKSTETQTRIRVHAF